MKNKKFKKLINGVLSAVLLLSIGASVAGCTNGEDSSNGNTNVETTVGTAYTYDTGIDKTATPLPLVENGVAKYEIILEANANTDVIAAVNEMNGYIREITGVSLAVRQESGAASGKFISIGKTQAATAAGIDVSTVKYDGYRIKSVDGNLYIAANLDRGLKYGVYGFIERFLGVRWLTDKYTYVPQATTTLNAYPCDIVDEPVFEMRNWMGGSTYLNKAFGDKCRYYTGGDVWCNDVNTGHNSTEYVSPDHVDPSSPEKKLLKETHPEYFSTATNTSAKTTEICFTNGITADGKLAEGQSVASLMIDKMISFLEKDDDRSIKYFMVGHVDDRAAICNCSTCMQRRAEIYDSGIHVMFMNVISTEVNKWLKENQNREANFVTFAYQYTEQPPIELDEKGNYKPINDLCIANDNVYIRIAPISANYTYSFADPRQPEDQKEIIFGWSTVAKNFMIWDYQCNYVEYFWYYPTTHYLKENLQTYADMGVVYMMNQSSYTQNGIWFDEMRNYVSSKLYWNLDWDMDYLINEYIDLCYDTAADEVKAIYALFDDYYAQLRMEENLTVSILSEQGSFLGSGIHEIGWLNKIVAAIDTAIANVKAEALTTGIEASELKERLEVIKLTPMRMILRNYTSYYFEDTKMAYAKEFFDLCDKYDIKYLGETGIRSVTTRKAEVGLA